MTPLQDDMQEYLKQMQKGTLPRAYRALMEFIMHLRNDLAFRYPEYMVTGIYPGYMDMTYFAFTPPSLQARKLKIAIVFIHESCRFEVWLAAANKNIQADYWKRIKDSGWNKYRLVPPGKGVDAILDHSLVQDPDFSNLEGLTNQIELETLKFIQDLESFMTVQDRD